MKTSEKRKQNKWEERRTTNRVVVHHGPKTRRHLHVI